jgi:hypothetical protein
MLRIFFTDDNKTRGLIYSCKQGSVDPTKPGAKIEFGNRGHLRSVTALDSCADEEKAQVAMDLFTHVRMQFVCVRLQTFCGPYLAP